MTVVTKLVGQTLSGFKRVPNKTIWGSHGPMTLWTMCGKCGRTWNDKSEQRFCWCELKDVLVETLRDSA